MIAVGFTDGGAPFRLVVTQLASLAPLIVPNDGGAVIAAELTGDPFEDGDYSVHVGPLGSVADPICYSGVSGRGSAIEITGNAFTCIVPILPVGGPYVFSIVPVDGSTPPRTTDALLTVIPHDFRTTVMTYRSRLVKGLVGYRKPSDEEFPQT